MYGRRIEQFVDCMNSLSEQIGLSEDLQLIIYIHNLSYEFQFIRKYFNWNKIFAREVRKPMLAETSIGISFRCSYVLSGYSLKKVAENLTSHNISKLVEQMDYSLIRTPETELTKDELEYAYNDIKIVEFFIAEEIERNGDITRIPMTQTGYVRRVIKNACYDRKNKPNETREFDVLIHSLTLEKDEFLLLKRCFAGGFTHANAWYTGDTLSNVASFDFASSYPAVMLNEKFPMSKGEYIGELNLDDFISMANSYACICDCKFFGIRPKLNVEHPISFSKCRTYENVVIDNGRVVSADYITTSLTDVDFEYILDFYDFDNIEIYNVIRYVRSYLPKQFIDAMLSLYEGKTKLKGVKGKEAEYMHSKQLINSMYGMTVTDIAPDTIEYENDEWVSVKGDVEVLLDEYNRKKKRFLFYPWGVYVTAYARRNLFKGIKEFDFDYVYSDTDSIKALNYNNHMKFIDDYNDKCIEKNRKACVFHGFSESRAEPEDRKGKKRYLGIWDFEGVYDRFKTLGAKRYMVEEDGKINITVSGVNKEKAVPYLLSISGDVFNRFNDKLTIPKGYSGKNVLTYIDDTVEGFIVDYEGNEFNYKELSGIHMEESEYSLSLSEQYINYLVGIRGETNFR